MGGVHRLTGDVEAHTHDFHEVAVVGAGTGFHVSSQGERALRSGDVVVLRPGAWHAYERCADLTVANCCISAPALRGELALLREVPLLRRLLWTGPIAAGTHGVFVASVDAHTAAATIEEIALLEADLASEPQRRGRVLGRLVTVLGMLADGLDADPPQDAAVHPAVAATVARLEAAPAQAWRLEDLAQAVNLDSDYLRRLFHRHMGLTPLAFLAQVRVERAATMLAHSTLSVSRVGAAVGWDDATYFARRFRVLVGLTPGEYRRRSQ